MMKTTVTQHEITYKIYACYSVKNDLQEMDINEN